MQEAEATQNIVLNPINYPPLSASKRTFRTTKRSQTTVVPLLKFNSQIDNKCSDKEIPSDIHNRQVNVKKNNLSEDEDDDDNSNDTSFECSHDIWESTNNDLALRGIDLDRQIDKNEQPFNILRLFKARSGQFRTLRENLSLEQAASQLRVLYKIAMEGRVKKKKQYPTFEDFIKSNQCNDNTDYTKSGISTVLFERFRDYYMKYKKYIAKKQIFQNLFQNSRTGAFSRSPRKKMTIEMFMNPKEQSTEGLDGVVVQKNNQDDSPQKGLIKKEEMKQQEEDEDVYQLSPQLLAKKNESPVLRKKQVIFTKYPTLPDQQQSQQKQLKQQQQNLHKKQPSLLTLEQIIQDNDVKQPPQNQQSSLDYIPLETDVTSSVSPLRPTTRSNHQRIITCSEMKSLSQTNLDDGKCYYSPRQLQKPSSNISKLPLPFPPAAINFLNTAQKNPNQKLQQPLPLQFQKEKSLHQMKDTKGLSTINPIVSLQPMENNTSNFVAFQKKYLKDIQETNIKRFIPKERNSDIIKSSFIEKNEKEQDKQYQNYFIQEELKRKQDKLESQETEEKQQQPENLSPLRYIQKQTSLHNTNRSLVQKIDQQIIRLNQNKTQQPENFSDSCSFQEIMDQQQQNNQSGQQHRYSIWEQDNNSSSPIKKKQRMPLSNQLTQFTRSIIPTTESNMLKISSQMPFNRSSNINNNISINNINMGSNHIVEPSSLSGAAARNRRLNQTIFPQNNQPFSMTNIMNPKNEKSSNDNEISYQKRNLCSLSYIPDEKIEKPIIQTAATAGVKSQNNFPSPLKNRLKLLETQSKIPNFINPTHTKGFQGEN